MEPFSSRTAAIFRAGQESGMTWRAGSMNSAGPFSFVDPLPPESIQSDRMARIQVVAVGPDWVEVQHFVSDEAGQPFRRLIPFAAITAVVFPPG